MLQLAGHLRSRAFQEWSLLDETEKHDFKAAVEALRGRLDCGGKVLAVQDFCHSAQGEKETVSELIRRLERTFRIGYGHDSMSVETRDALLYSQLQEALKHELMRSPAVSGSTSYKDLCVAAKNEERISGLKKWEAYNNKLDGYTSQSSFSEAPKRARSTTHSNSLSEKPDVTQGGRPATSNGGPRCFTCESTGHLAQVESKGPVQHYSQQNQKKSDVRAIWVNDQGSHPHCVTRSSSVWNY